MVSRTHRDDGFLANHDRFAESNSHSSCSSQDFWCDLRILKYDCIKGVVMSDSFEQAWRVVKALPEQQAIHRRGPKQFRFAELSETGGPDMGEGAVS